MFEYLYGQINNYQLILLAISAILIGINKTGIPAIGPLPVVLMAMAFGGNESTGVVLVILGITDIIAVSFYRKSADWRQIVRLIPCALVGLGAGWLILPYLNDIMMQYVIAIIILVLSAFNFVKKYLFPEDAFSSRLNIVAPIFGFLAGLTTQLANAAGPVMAVYLLLMRLPKQTYMGTAAWYFLILNWLKIPIFISLDRINWETFRSSIGALPFMLIGAFAGYALLRKIPQKYFENAVQILIVISALWLLFNPVKDKAAADTDRAAGGNSIIEEKILLGDYAK
ncbi:MAG: sulfite exporter TauE/SafE family protein [Lentisphaeria bacterium]|nr:sulfite exporter TauE/SafE family protein [Lentisphaeria bacterium]